MSSLTACLAALPDELTLAIIDHIVDDTHSLISLNRTSTQFHRLTLDRLYSRFAGRNSELFLRTISSKPDLARYVRQAEWHRERKTRRCIDNIEKTHIVRTLNQLAVPQQGTDLAEQFARFGKHDDYWYMEVLLLYMPNLDRITIRDSWLWDDHHYWFKSLSPFFNPLCTSKLTAATLYGPLRIENIVPLFTIPTLRTLELTEVIEMRREGYRVFQWSIWPVDRVLPASDRSDIDLSRVGASNLENLILRESFIHLGDLIPIMCGIKALKTFTYEHRHSALSNWEEDHYDQMNRIAIPQICDLLHASLTHLKIRTIDLWHWNESILDTSRHQNPLPRALHTLDLGPVVTIMQSSSSSINQRCDTFITGLPEGLRVLKIAVHELEPWEDPESDTWDEMEPETWKSQNVMTSRFLTTLAHSANIKKSKLKEIILVDWSPLLGWFPDSLPVLQKQYRELGIRLTTVPGNIFDYVQEEPFLVDDDDEPGWVMITASKRKIFELLSA